MHRLLLELPERLETERLVLRPYRAGDGPVYFAVCQRNREHLVPYEADNPARKVQTVEDAEVLVRQFAADWISRRAFFLGAWHKDDGAFAAQVYVGATSWELPEFEIGYFVDRDHEGRGFVVEAVKACLSFAFEALGAHRASLRCSDTNARSSRVAERCGFVLEGHLRQTDRRIRREDGTLGGVLLYGMLREEFEALK
jgi:ribosomal-protein-serine acetyltransferase